MVLPVQVVPPFILGVMLYVTVCLVVVGLTIEPTEMSEAKVIPVPIDVNPVTPPVAVALKSYTTLPKLGIEELLTSIE
jgi:hypothetical protein